MRVLIAEDDRRVAGLLKNRLKSDHISADVCYDWTGGAGTERGGAL